MLVNKDTAVSTCDVLLVPYEEWHVPEYHSWMQDEEIQKATASEPLTLEEEYNMQRSWRSDADKLTFIICTPLSTNSSEAKDGTVVNSTTTPSAPVSSSQDMHTPSITEELLRHSRSPSNMLGDINLFLSASDEDSQGLIGELELMIPFPRNRRCGYGRQTLLAFMKYIDLHLPSILIEYAESDDQYQSQDADGSLDKLQLTQLRVKISHENHASIKLFESVGFIKVSEEPNYFGELELVLEGFLGRERVNGLLECWAVKEWREIDITPDGDHGRETTT